MRRRLATNAAVSALAQMLGKLCTLLWTLVVVRELSQSEFGAFSFALTVALLVSTVAEWGFDPVLVRRASRSPARVEQYFTEAVAWQTALGIPVFVAAGVLAVLSRPAGPGRTVLVLLLLAIFLDLWNDTARSAAAAMQDQVATSLALVLQRLATTALVIPVLLGGGGLVGLSSAFLAAYVLGFVAHQAALRRLGIRFRPTLLRRDRLGASLRGTGVIGVSALVLAALSRLDAVLLAELRGEAALGAYAAAYRLFETMLFVVFAIASALYPVMSAAGQDRGALLRALRNGLTATCVCYLPFAVAVLVDAPDILRLLFGAAYSSSTSSSLRWLAFGPLAFGTAFLLTSALTAVRATRGVLVAAVVAAAVNLAANLLLIPQYGGAAAGATTTLSYALQAAVLLVVLRRLHGRVALFRPWVLPVAAAAVMAGWLVASPLTTLAEVPVGALLYVVTWLALVRWFDPEQASDLESLFARTRRSHP